MARILVTTAMGNVGREVARECIDRGFDVRVSARDINRLKASYPRQDAARLDFSDRATWSSALSGCDRLFLLRPPPLGDMQTTLNPFVDAAYDAGVGHIVFLSVAGADRMKWVPHRKVELHLMAVDKGWTILRPGFFAQNLEDAYRRDIVEDDRLYVPAGSGRVAFLDVRDVGAVAGLVFQDPGRFQAQALTLTGPSAIGFDEVAAVLSTTLGRPIRYRPASILGYARHLRAARGLPWMQIIVQTFLHVGLRRGDAEQVVPTVEELLGRPPHSLREYVERMAEAWQRPVGTRRA
jgi:uncharacterized protein YbjT (DUF2867 family)